MARYKVVLSKSSKLDHRRIAGLGLFKRGEPQTEVCGVEKLTDENGKEQEKEKVREKTFELSDGQVASLEVRRFKVTKVAASEKKGG